MKTRLIAGMSLLLVGLMSVAGAAQAVDAMSINELSGGNITSNVQPGELGIQSRLTVRRAAIAYGGDPGLRMMGASGPMRPVLIDPPAPTH